ncbi:MAG: AAA family ATPase [Oscillospiraceae bacterium]|nr:AAA family ATPase [Oscillospiraceae bacterium]
MALVISVVTQKGGVGKTTAANALSSVIRASGKKILAVDFDPQANLSYSFGADTTDSLTIYNVLRGDAPAGECIISTAVGDIIACDILLNSAELEFVSDSREYLLKNALKSIMKNYDYIIIDCPPGLGILTACALCTSDYVIVPMLPDSFSLQGIVLINDTINRVRKSCNPNVQIAGVLINRFSPFSRHHREARKTADMIAGKCGIRVFDTIIRSCPALSEAHTLQTDITEYRRCRRAMNDYMRLFHEMQQKQII